MYALIKKEGRAKRAVFTTPHGEIQTPVFMNVATAAAIKGALSAADLVDAGCQVALCNTYHLHVRPGEDIVRHMGGVRRFMAWDGPVLTDSGGFQVFSLTALRKIKEEGVYFSSHVDGRKIFMGPEESMTIQSTLGSTIAMAFDECAPYPAERDYMQASVDRTTRWLARCKSKMAALNAEKNTEAYAESNIDAQIELNINSSIASNSISNTALNNNSDIKQKAFNPGQFLFGINQGGTYEDIRIEHAKRIVDMALDGYALGGLAVGETHNEMYRIIETVVPYLPVDKPTYLMGVGTPENILEAVARGVDFFDCVLPARNGRHAHVYTARGKLNLNNAQYERDDTPIDPVCGCTVCRTHTRAYIRHLFKAREMLAMRLCVMHNLFFYNQLMAEIRDALDKGCFHTYMKTKLYEMAQ